MAFHLGSWNYFLFPFLLFPFHRRFLFLFPFHQCFLSPFLLFLFLFLFLVYPGAQPRPLTFLSPFHQCFLSPFLFLHYLLHLRHLFLCPSLSPLPQDWEEIQHTLPWQLDFFPPLQIQQHKSSSYLHETRRILVLVLGMEVAQSLPLHFPLPHHYHFLFPFLFLFLFHPLLRFHLPHSHHFLFPFLFHQYHLLFLFLLSLQHPSLCLFLFLFELQQQQRSSTQAIVGLRPSCWYFWWRLDFKSPC